MGICTNMSICSFTSSDGDGVKLILVTFVYRDVDEFFFLSKWVWDSKTRLHPVPLPSLDMVNSTEETMCQSYNKSWKLSIILAKIMNRSRTMQNKPKFDHKKLVVKQERLWREIQVMEEEPKAQKEMQKANEEFRKMMHDYEAHREGGF